MKKIVSFLFSMFFTVLLLIMFAISIAYATFIENDYGTSTAQVLIYQAWWFELLLSVGVINLAGSIFRYKLVNRKKWAILMFHLAFILIIIGAGVTRYFGFEGSMHIREGESTNQVVSGTSYITLKAIANSSEVNSMTQVAFTPNTNNNYKKTLQVDGKEVTVENELFVTGASETIVPDANGSPILSLIYSDGINQHIEFYITPNQKKQMPLASFGFETGEGSAKVVFNRTNNGLSMICADTVAVTSMTGPTGEKLLPLVSYPINENTLYQMGQSGFVFKSYMAKAIPALVQSPDQSQMGGMNAFTAKITSGNEVRRVNVFEKDGEITDPATCTINGINLSISYGAVTRELPFSIFLRDFQLERYPGSMSPSSYASEITLKDPAVSVERPFRIFMNNILKYQGYRFFQSSFDQDEKGTVLSVNQDYWGTLISYLGYFFMTLGMIFTVFSKGSRFQTLIRLSSKLQAQRHSVKILTIGLLVTGLSLLGNSAFAASNSAAKNKHINAFSELLVQDHQGRIEPISTLASDLLRKIAKADNWEGMSSVEFFLEMSANPEKWKTVPLIKVGNPELSRTLGASGGFITFRQMFDQSGNYRLNEMVQQAYNKKQTLRNKLDKEIMNVDERVNICYQIFNGDFLKIFPVPNDERKTWVTSSTLPKTMKKEESDFAGNILNMYYESYFQAEASGNWSKPDENLGYIKKFQRTYGADIIPSSTKISMEIFYNEWNIFGKMAKIYALLGFVLLVVHFMLIFKPGKGLLKYVNIGTILIGLAFLCYTFGVIARWYISGHAPWSNGYETMIYVGWATSLSGFIFLKRSPITLAVTTLLASIILFVTQNHEYQIEHSEQSAHAQKAVTGGYNSNMNNQPIRFQYRNQIGYFRIHPTHAGNKKNN